MTLITVRYPGCKYMPMPIYIPEIGDILELEECWTFKLFQKGRNQSLIDMLALGQHPPGKQEAKERAVQAKEAYLALGARERNSREEVTAAYTAWKDAMHEAGGGSWKVTLPATTKLKVSRIYIRVGAADYSSLTFTIVETPLVSPLGKKTKGRPAFWAKLSDVNKMVIKVPGYQ